MTASDREQLARLFEDLAREQRFCSVMLADLEPLAEAMARAADRPEQACRSLQALDHVSQRLSCLAELCAKIGDVEGDNLGASIADARGRSRLSSLLRHDAEAVSAAAGEVELW